MRKNRADAVRIASTATGYDTTVIDREYDLMMPAMSSDGKFDRKGLAVVARSFVDLGMVPTPPDMTPLYTEAYLPKN
jgi:hypothetical protein